MKKWFNLCIVFALIFGGGLCVALHELTAALVLLACGGALAYFWKSRNLLPE